MSQKCCSIKDFGLNGKILRSFNAKSRNFLAVNFNKQQFMLNLLHGLVVNARNSFILSFLSAVKLWLPNISCSFTQCLRANRDYLVNPTQ